MAWRDRDAPAVRRSLPAGFIAPCLPTRGQEVPTGPLWIHEIKHDGFRFICRRDGDRVRIFTRRGNDWTERVPAVVEAMRALPGRSATIDGEAVICRPDGLSDFDALRLALARGDAPGAFLYAFDLLELDGQDVRRQPWEARRKALTRLLQRSPPGLQVSEHMDGQEDGRAVFRAACELGLEGIVSKKRTAPYRSGRSPDWIKVKNPSAPAVTRVLEEHA